ncbi:hypothetical protein VNI00_013878 [Paramarasmius palmivorus]|uniref:Uncharacterized protein n=1 Tax=Paramarasmius palmivorus TaxID=297713 RepID=A0AAW0BVZ7_9AGAR
MYVFRLDPFVSEAKRAIDVTWEGTTPKPLDHEPKFFEWQLDEYISSDGSRFETFWTRDSEVGGGGSDVFTKKTPVYCSPPSPSQAPVPSPEMHTPLSQQQVPHGFHDSVTSPTTQIFRGQHARPAWKSLSTSAFRSDPFVSKAKPDTGVTWEGPSPKPPDDEPKSFEWQFDGYTSSDGSNFEPRWRNDMESYDEIRSGGSDVITGKMPVYHGPPQTAFFSPSQALALYPMSHPVPEDEQRRMDYIA